MKKFPLLLHEELLLLILKNREGTFQGTWREITLGAALLVDLLLYKFVTLEQTGRKTVLVPFSLSPPNDPLLAEAFALIRNSGNRCQADYWITKFSQISQLAHRTAEGLIEEKIIRAESQAILLIFNRTLYPEIDPKPEQEIIQRMQQAIAGIEEIGDRTAALIAIANQAQLLPYLFSSEFLKLHRQRIKDIGAGNVAVRGTKDAIVNIQIMINASIVPIVCGYS